MRETLDDTRKDSGKDSLFEKAIHQPVYGPLWISMEKYPMTPFPGISP